MADTMILSSGKNEFRLRHECGSLMILIDQKEDSIEFAVHNGSEVTHVGAINKGEKPIGKLTGVQMRGIAAIDQLEAMMQDRLAGVIKTIVGINDPHELYDYLARELLNELHEEERGDLLKTITAMALFAYRELIDRGMLPPHEPNQEPNDDGDIANS